MPVDDPRKTPLVFYRTIAGAEIIRDWLRNLPAPDRHAIGQDIMRAQFRWPVGMPLCRPFGGGLWEVRSDLTGNRIARIVFFVCDGCMVAVHGFIKKTRKTPIEDLNLARKRQREFLR
jgi:phage-related protein